MKITRGTTPDIKINVKSEIDLHTITVIWVYIYQNKQLVVDKGYDDLTFDYDNRQIIMRLSQEDTLGMKPGDGIFQTRLLLTDGTSLASKASKITVEDVYKDGVIQ